MTRSQLCTVNRAKHHTERLSNSGSSSQPGSKAFNGSSPCLSTAFRFRGGLCRQRSPSRSRLPHPAWTAFMCCSIPDWGQLWQELPPSTLCTVDNCTASSAHGHCRRGIPVAAADSINSAHCSGDRKS